MWQSINGIIAEIKRCEEAGATIAAVSMAYICIDTMAFLSMPDGQNTQTRQDFINWVNTYLHAHEQQPYQYDGMDVYAARCALLHAFSAEAQRHRDDPNIKKYTYSDGGQHFYNPEVSPNVVIIGTASFLNDIVIAVGEFMRACQNDAALRQRAVNRLPGIYQLVPFPQVHPEQRNVNDGQDQPR